MTIIGAHFFLFLFSTVLGSLNNETDAALNSEAAPTISKTFQNLRSGLPRISKISRNPSVFSPRSGEMNLNQLRVVRDVGNHLNFGKHFGLTTPDILKQHPGQKQQEQEYRQKQQGEGRIRETRMSPYQLQIKQRRQFYDDQFMELKPQKNRPTHSQQRFHNSYPFLNQNNYKPLINSKLLTAKTSPYTNAARNFNLQTLCEASSDGHICNGINRDDSDSSAISNSRINDARDKAVTIQSSADIQNLGLNEIIPGITSAIKTRNRRNLDKVLPRHYSKLSNEMKWLLQKRTALPQHRANQIVTGFEDFSEFKFSSLRANNRPNQKDRRYGHILSNADDNTNHYDFPDKGLVEQIANFDDTNIPFKNAVAHFYHLRSPGDSDNIHAYKRNYDGVEKQKSSDLDHFDLFLNRKRDSQDSSIHMDQPDPDFGFNPKFYPEESGPNRNWKMNLMRVWG